MRDRFAVFLTGLRVLGRSWWRIAAVSLLISGVGAMVLWAGMAVAGEVIADRSRLVDPSGRITLQGQLLLAVSVMLPIVAAGAAVAGAMAGAVSALADDALAGRRGRTLEATRRGLRRMPAVVGSLVVAVAVVFAVTILTPVTTLAGAVGLLLTPFLPRIQRRRPAFLLPATNVLLILLVPLAVPIVLAARLSLVIPAAALEGKGPVGALGHSWVATHGRAGRTVGNIALGVAAYWLALVVVVGLARWTPLADLVISLLRVGALFVVTALPVVIMTILHRGHTPRGPEPAPARGSSPGPSLTPATATALVLAVLASSVGFAPVPRSHAAVPATFVVTDGGDTGDADPADGSCDDGTGSCTLRAAIEQAAASSPAGAVVQIATASTIRPATPLLVTTSMSIIGTVDGVELSGDPCGDCAPTNQIMRLETPGTNIEITNVLFRSGVAGGGGGAIWSVADGELSNVTFQDNWTDEAGASGSGGAIAVRGGTLAITNATFDGNRALEGADVDVRAEAPAASASVSINHSTFVGSTGGAVFVGAGGTADLSASIVEPALDGKPNCSGVAVGAVPSLDVDGTCGTPGVGSLATATIDNGGPVPTVRIDPTSGAVDLGGSDVGVDGCPATDARGIARPKNGGCDLGAYEYTGATAFDFVVNLEADTGDADVDDLLCDVDVATPGSQCTLRAAVEQSNGALALPATVTFAEGITSIVLATPLEIRGNVSIIGTDRNVTLSGSGLDAVVAGRTLSLVDLELSGMASVADGGALRTVADTTIRNVTFAGNTSGTAGGAIAASAGTLDLVNTTFDGNAAPVGGDLALTGTVEASLLHVTLARAAGGAIVHASDRPVSVTSSIIAPADGDGCVGSVTAVASIVSDATCGGTEVSDAGLEALAPNGGAVRTIALAPSSPAIDGADGAACPALDARGHTRPDGGGCDAGAFEAVRVATDVSFVVDSALDTPDLVAGDGSCEDASGNCTLRAALQEASAATSASPGTAGRYRITFDLDVPTQITLGGTALALAAEVEVDGVGGQVTISADGLSEVLVVAPSGYPWAVRNVTIADGVTTHDEGGAGIRSWAQGVVEAVTFVNNASQHGGGGGGGAIAAHAGGLAITNATFEDNSAPAVFGGSDVWAGTSTTIVNSSFWGVQGVRLQSAAASVELHNSLVRQSGAAGIACGGGGVTGSNNLVPDGTCPGTTGHVGVGSFGDNGGPVPTLGLVPGSAALDAGDPAHCPSHDARGLPRAAGACDVGATEYDRVPVVEVERDADTIAFGQPLEVTTTVRSRSDAGVPEGSIAWEDEDGNPLGTEQLDGTGTAVLSDVRLSVGSHTITASFTPTDGLFEAGSGEAGVEVGTPATVVDVTATPSPSTLGEDVVVRVEVSSAGAGTAPTQHVDVRVDGGPVLTADLAPGFRDGHVIGFAELELTGLALGTRAITVEYPGDGQYPGGSGELEHVVRPVATMALTADRATAVFGELVALTATISPLPEAGGDVTFLIGEDAIGTAQTDVDGVATLRTALPVGDQRISASHEGDDLVGPSTSEPTEVVVSKAATAVDLGSTADSSAFGEPIDLVATVTTVAPGAGQPQGDVTFSDGSAVLGSATLVDGTATLEGVVLAWGVGTIAADYPGSGNHVGDEAEAAHTVAAAATSVAVTPPAGETPRRAPASFGVVVTSDAPSTAVPTGTVALVVDGVTHATSNLVDGAANLETSDLVVGTHDVEVHYDGGGGFLDDDAVVEHTVSRMPTTVEVGASPTSSITGQVVTFEIAVLPSIAGGPVPTGEVHLRDWPTTAASATATLDALGRATIVAASPEGGRSYPYHPTVVYGGDDDHAVAASAEREHRVHPADVRVTLTPSTTAAEAGKPFHVTVDLTAVAPATGAPRGWVTISDHGNPLVTRRLVTGTADIPLSTISELAPGFQHDLRATFTADDGLIDPFRLQPPWRFAESSLLGVYVAPATPTLTVSHWPESPGSGSDVTFNVAFSGPAGPPSSTHLTFYDGLEVLGTAPIGGSWGHSGFNASFTTRLFDSGAHAITVRFPGDALYDEVTSDVHLVEVGGVPTRTWFTTVPTSPVPAVGVTTWRVFVGNRSSSPANWALPPVGQVVLEADGLPTWGGTTTLAPGQEGVWSVSTATFTTTPLPPGTKTTVRARYAGQSPFVGSIGSVEVDIPRSPTTLTVTPLPDTTATRANTIAVSVSSDGLDRPTGTITLSAPFAEPCVVQAPRGHCSIEFSRSGRFTLTASYEGDDRSAPSTANQKVTVRKHPTSITASLDGRQLNGRRVSGDPLTLSWSVQGVEDGQGGVLIDFPGTCGTGLVGTCAGSFENPATSSAANPIVRVRFPETDSHEASSWEVEVELAACMHLDEDITTGGSLSYLPDPNCNGGTGFVDGTLVRVTAQPDPAPQGLERRTRWGNGNVQLGTAPIEQWVTADWSRGNWRLSPRYTFDTVTPCVDVRFQGSGNAHGHTSPPEDDLPVPNCEIDDGGRTLPDHLKRWVRGGGLDATGEVQYRLTGRFEVGTVIAVPEPDLSGRRVAFFGVEVDGVPLPEPPATIVADGDKLVRYVGGPACSSSFLVAPPEANAEITTPHTCDNPWGDGPGWRDGDSVGVRAIPSPNWYLQFVSGQATLPTPLRSCPTGGAIDGCELQALRYGWTHRVVAPLTFAGYTPEVTPHVLTVSQCVKLDINPLGKHADDTIEVYGDACPIRPADTGWYRGGEEVAVHLTLGRDSRWGKWNDAELDSRPPWSPYSNLVFEKLTLDEDRTLRPSFVPSGSCPTITVRTDHPDRTEIAVTEGGVDDRCRNGNLAGGRGVSVSGETNLPLTIRGVVTDGTNPLVGWRILRDDTWVQHTIGGLAGRVQADWNPKFSQTAALTLCQRIVPNLVIEGLDGHSSTSGRDIVTAAHAKEHGLDTRTPAQQFVGFDPEPNCPFDTSAWLAGTNVRVEPAHDSDAYTFRSFKGRSGSAFTVHLDGSQVDVEVEGRFRVVCHRLTLRGRVNDVELIPEPNCPGRSEAFAAGVLPGRLYQGGTPVLLIGDVPNDRVWQGWTGDVEAEDDQKLPMANPVTLVMDGDKTAEHRWREKDWDEEFVEFFEDVGTTLANLGKKAAGVVSWTLMTAAQEIPPISWIFSPLDFLEELYSVLDDYNSVVDGLGSALGVDLDVLKAPKQCWEVDRLYSDGIIAPFEICDYLPQEAFEAVEIYQQSADLIAASATCAAEWGLGGDGKRAGNVVALADSMVDFKGAVDDAKDAYEDGKGVETKTGAAVTGRDAFHAGEDLYETSGAMYEAAKAAYENPDLGWDTSSSLANVDAFKDCAADAEPDFLKDPRPIPDDVAPLNAPI